MAKKKKKAKRNRRPKVPTKVERAVLTKCLRRCAMCYVLDERTESVRGQLAHIDRDNTNNQEANICLLCERHHDEYDGVPSQSKRYQPYELANFKLLVERWASDFSGRTLPANRPELAQADMPRVSAALWNKRIEIYRVVRTLCGHILRNATITLQELADFTRGVDEAIFLFDNEVLCLLNELRHAAVRLMSTNEQLDDPGLPLGPKRSQLAQENSEYLMKAIEVRDAVVAAMRPHLIME